MRTDEARSVPVALTQKLMERGAITSSSTAALLPGRTEEKAPDFKSDNPPIRTNSPISANEVRFMALLESFGLGFGDSAADGGVAVCSGKLCGVVSLISYQQPKAVL